MSLDLKTLISLNYEEGSQNDHVRNVLYQALQLDDLVEKVESKRYQAATYDMMRAVIMLFSGDESTYVR